MRLPFALISPALLVVPLAGCGGGSASSSDGGLDGTLGDGTLDVSASDEFDLEAPVVGDTGTMTRCTLNDADPVGLCVQKAALLDLHQHAFASGKGAAASWNSTTEKPDTNDAGAVVYTLDDTVSYAASAASYLASATVYGDTTLSAALQADLQAIALQLETSFTPPATEYSGELYASLRAFASGLRLIDLETDGDKVDTLADSYGRSIASHFVPLGTIVPPGGSADAGAADGGQVDATVADGSVDAGMPVPDASPAEGGAPRPDGVIGNKAGAEGVAYAPDDVATAAYALLDMVARHPNDSAVPTWLADVRASLRHIEARAKEPTTGMFYQALVASTGDGGSSDMPLAGTDPAFPGGAVLAGTQATIALAMIEAQALVAANTTTTLTGLDASAGAVNDAGVTGPFVSILDLPLAAWGRTAIDGMNGTPSLWDAPPADAGSLPWGGYMDGYVPSSHTLLTTKSTRPNALVAAAVRLAFVNTGDATYYAQRAPIVTLLVAVTSVTTSPNTSFVSVLPNQTAYLRATTEHFLPLDAGPTPLSYTSAAVSAAVLGLNAQLDGTMP